jgi:hypothetical protein
MVFRRAVDDGVARDGIRLSRSVMSVRTKTTLQSPGTAGRWPDARARFRAPTPRMMAQERHRTFKMVVVANRCLVSKARTRVGGLVTELSNRRRSSVKRNSLWIVSWLTEVSTQNALTSGAFAASSRLQLARYGVETDFAVVFDMTGCFRLAVLTRSECILRRGLAARSWPEGATASRRTGSSRSCDGRGRLRVGSR